MNRFDPVDVEDRREVQRRRLLELKLSYEGQLDDKERELTRIKEKLAK